MGDETLVNPETARPKAKLNPINWTVPWLGYGYVPLVIGLGFMDRDPFPLFCFSTGALLFLLPVYGLFIFKLTAQRKQQGTNRVGLTLFQILSMVLPTLWGLFGLIVLLGLNGMI